MNTTILSERSAAPLSSMRGNAAQQGARGPAFLLRPPVGFRVEYAINPWMRPGLPIDPSHAYMQWSALLKTLEQLGCMVSLLPADPSFPDGVFAADAGLVDPASRRFVPSRFRYAERRHEVDQAMVWMRQAGYEIAEFPVDRGVFFEGSGDAVLWQGCVFAGHGFRTSRAAHQHLAHLLDREVVPVGLVDPRFYHLDLTFCPLGGERAIIFPDAWDPRTRATMQRYVRDPLVLNRDEAQTFCANSICLGNALMMPACPPRVRSILEGWGLDVFVTPVTEFLKAGGAVHCLALPLGEACLACAFHARCFQGGSLGREVLT
jgi:N-dimethylarginine dimethylaminohydrolase